MGWFSSIFSNAIKKAKARINAIKKSKARAAAAAIKKSKARAAAMQLRLDTDNSNKLVRKFDSMHNYVNATHLAHVNLKSDILNLESDAKSNMPNISLADIKQNINNEQYTMVKNEYDKLKLKSSNINVIAANANSKYADMSESTNNILQNVDGTYGRVHNKMVKFIDTDKSKNNIVFSKPTKLANSTIGKLDDIETIQLDSGAIAVNISDIQNSVKNIIYDVNANIKSKIVSNKVDVAEYVTDIGGRTKQWKPTVSIDTFNTMGGKQPYEFRHNVSNAFSHPRGISQPYDYKSNITTYKSNVSSNSNYSIYI